MERNGQNYNGTDYSQNRTGYLFPKNIVLSETAPPIPKNLTQYGFRYVKQLTTIKIWGQMRLNLSREDLQNEVKILIRTSVEIDSKIPQKRENNFCESILHRRMIDILEKPKKCEVYANDQSR